MPFVILFVLLMVAGFFGWRAWLRVQTRKALLNKPLSAQMRKRLARLVPLTTRLPALLRDQLEGKINVFLAQVDFVGCDGLEVTEDMRLSIAGQACLLVVNMDAWYDHLNTILIYPGAFKSVDRVQDGYVVTEVETVRLGESWSRGPVVLSWDHSRQGGLNDRDGHNVVLHEFAHRIDDLSGQTDGAPLLNDGQSYARWERVILAAFDRLTQALHAGQKTVIDPYGATGHEEFFAVTVELFFERPHALFEAEPDVYTELSTLFQLDPRNWD